MERARFGGRPGARGRDRSEEARVTREAILAAFLCECAERGYREVDLAAVAERAGVSAAEMHRHFAGKEACAVAAVNAALSDAVVAVASSYDPDRSEFDSLIAGIAAILALIAEKPASARFGYIDARQMATPAVHEIYETGLRTLGAMLERGWEYSELRHRPSMIGRAILGATEAVIRRELIAGRAAQVPALLPDFVYMATVPFLGQEEASQLAERARRGAQEEAGS